MAIIKLGTTIVGIRGTIDGITYSANKAGPHAKGWSRGANPRTSKQSLQRNNQSAQAASWRSISAVLQAAWNTWAALPAQARTNSLGVSYNISGFAWFTLLNTNLYNSGSALITAVPVLAIPTAPILAGVTVRSDATGGNSNMNYQPADPGIGPQSPILCQLANSIGRNVANPRAVIVWGQPTVALHNIFFHNEIRARFGSLYIGQKAFFTTCYQNAEGRRGPFSSINSNVT